MLDPTGPCAVDALNGSTGTELPSKPFNAGAPPFYGTCVMSSFMARLSSSIVRCWTVTVPAEPYSVFLPAPNFEAFQVAHLRARRHDDHQRQFDQRRDRHEAAAAIESRDFVTALARGLQVIDAFGAQSPEMTLSEVAKHTA